MSWSASAAAPEAPRSWGWARLDGRNVLAVPAGAAVRLYDSDDFILLHEIAPAGHRSAVRFVRWSAFHGKLASLSATQIMVHAPQRGGPRRVAYAPLCDFSLLGGPALWVRNLAFSRCTDRLLFSGRGGQARDGRAHSLGLLDVRADARAELDLRVGRDHSDQSGPLLWSSPHEDCDVAKFSPNAFVFASLSPGARGPTVWRMKAAAATGTAATATLVVAGTEALTHGREDGDRVLYFSWKPARTPRHAEHETDGCRRPQWFEPARVLLTCTAARAIRVWTEEPARDPQGLPRFVPALAFSPPHPIDNFRWVMSKSRHMRDERFRVDDAGADAADEWISGVDRRGVLRLWRLRGLYASAAGAGVAESPTVEETPFQLQVDDHVEASDADANGRTTHGVVHGGFGEACVMAYFSDNAFGLPSRFDIVLERADHIMLSFDVAVDVAVDVVKDRRRSGDGAASTSALPSLRRSLGAQPAARIRKKSWFRSHVGAIAALAAHPSLPLVASVDAPGPGRGRTEVLIYWLSFSAFSAETRLIPSGVLPCAEDDRVLCIQWIPTLHFDATPMLLVAFASGAVSVYGRSATAAGVVGSPALKPASSPSEPGGSSAPLFRSPSLAPWTYFDYATGESGTEYEVSVVKRSDQDTVVALAASFSGDRRRLVVVGRPEEQTAGDQSGERLQNGEALGEGDELVAVDGTSVVGQNVEHVRDLLAVMPTGRAVTLRLRAGTSNASLASVPELSLPPRECDAEEKSPRCVSSTPFVDKYSSGPLEAEAQELQRGLLTTLRAALPTSPPPAIVHAGSVSTYGGWMRLLRAKVAPQLALVCVCPAYADDGEYVPDVTVVFGLAALPGPLLAWRGARSKDARTFDLQPLDIERGFASGRNDIMAISGERDYRQRAFSSKAKSKGADAEDGEGLNSLLFVGGASGDVEHWRCRVAGGEIYFTLMSAFPADQSPTASVPLQQMVGGAFYRRGYVASAQPGSRVHQPMPDAGILHIEVDDPNRIAVVRADRPDEIDILEAESGLGILRRDECIREGGLRGRVLGLCWCASHVEFNVDALAVNYASGLVVYQFHTGTRRWTPVGDSIGGSFALFDCTRDSSALLIGGGSQPVVTNLPGARRVHYEDETNNQSEEEDPPDVSNEMPMVVGKWDEPGHLLQDAMDWKSPVRPQKLPVWHPYVVLTTLFGMHARVGEKVTSLAGDKVTYEFSRAFKDAVQMLKLLSRVLEDDAAARRSARTGVLSVSAKRARSVKQESDASSENGIEDLDSGNGNDAIGRYSTAIHKNPALNKAEFLFAPPPESVRRPVQRHLSLLPDDNDGARAADLTTLSRTEMDVLHSALDVLLDGRDLPVKENALRLFGSFETEHLVEMKTILSYVDAIQSLGFDLDASGADLGAKRYFAMHLFTKALTNALAKYGARASTTPNGSHVELLGSRYRSPANGSSSSSLTGSTSSSESMETNISTDESASWLREVPSSGVLWALHSDAQHFLLQHCCTDPQLTWQEHLRPMWLGLWVKDVQDLREVVERFAKQLYARSRDAMRVCLFYVALGKSNILGALAKMARDEQNRKLSAFLEHDFSQERWCNAAVKNAYSLLSKKQFEASAAFFLLCEPPRLQEAVRVLAVRLADPSLALVVSRLVEHRASTQFQHDFMAVSSQRGVSPAGDVTKRLLRDDVVPMFRERGDRWLESCALWWLEEFEQACAILSPPSQDVDVVVEPEDTVHGGAPLVKTTQAVVRFYVNLTSITIYFQYLHSSDNASMLNWAKTVRRAKLKAVDFESPLSISHAGVTSPGRFRLASVTDIEHAFSFAAYVCKRNGLSDTALVEMLQARHLINTHARFDMSVLDASDAMDGALSSVVGDASPTSPRLRASMRRLAALKKTSNGEVAGNPLMSPRLASSMRSLLVSRLSCVTSDDWVTSGGGASGGGGSSSPWSASPRRMSDINQSFSPTWRSPVSSPRGHRKLQRARTSSDWSELVPGAESLDDRRHSPAVTPWLKAQLADIECRRWASSAFVGKMIGLRVAREMISHFRADLDHLFLHSEEGSEASSPDQGADSHSQTQSAGDRHSVGHRRYLEELCAPLCSQFQVDRAYVLEAALAVLHPHAHLHLAEVCFLLSQLRRRSALTKWIQYVALSVLRSCATFASCRVTDHVYRDWEGLTVQLCYLLHLDATREIALPAEVVAQVTVAVRTGVLFLGWIRHRADIVHAAITRPFVVPQGDSAKLSAAAFTGHLSLLRKLESSDTARSGGQMNRERTYDSKVGFTFLGSVASYLADRDNAADEDGNPSAFTQWGDVHNSAAQHQFKVRKMYTLVLLVSILRTLYARARSFLDAVSASEALTLVARHESDDEEDHSYAEKQELDIASSLFTPRKLWKDLGEGPLEGVKRWFTLTESHLRFEFDYSVREVQCVCGLYGLDGAAFDLTARSHRRRPSHGSSSPSSLSAFKANDDTSGSPSNPSPQRATNWLDRIESPRSDKDVDVDGDAASTWEDMLVQRLEERGLTRDLHWAMVRTSDDYVLALMRAGVVPSVRRFRADPRVYVDCFLLRDAFRWFADFAIFADPIVDGHAFLARCCKQRKLRLLVAHRGQDTNLFPHSTPSPSSASPAMDSNGTARHPTASSDDGDHTEHYEHDREAAAHLPASFFLQAMMFVDPWEVEAVASARRYLHGMTAPRHVELGRDRLSPLCDETCDDILASVFARDADLVRMWKESHGEGWLVTSITQFQLDGVRSIRRRPTFSSRHLSAGKKGGREDQDEEEEEEEEPKIPFLVEIHSRAQRNAMFQETGLPHRFVGLVTVSLLAARDLMSCNWITEGSDPYVFFELLHAHETPRAEPDGWSVSTYRSRVSPGKNPTWGTPDDQFAFRFAVPTHEQHVAGRVRRESSSGSHRFSVTSAESTSTTAAAELWAAQVPEDCDEAVDALESLLPPLFRGPPTVLHCTVFHKNKVLAHQLMGRGEVELSNLTSGAPLDCWVPLDGGRGGALHVRVSLSFQLMCSSVAGANELQALR